jgi:hypothetical protein
MRGFSAILFLNFDLFLYVDRHATTLFKFNFILLIVEKLK